LAAPGRTGGTGRTGGAGRNGTSGVSGTSPDRHAASSLPDEAFATLPKLKLAAFLAGCGEAEFATVAATCAIGAPTLSKAAVALEEAGYVKVRKGHVGRRPRTWLSLTAKGRKAFEAHLAALAGLTAQGRALVGDDHSDGESDGDGGEQ
jgi:DNA-binding MarR family transcriptional regulator